MTLWQCDTCEGREGGASSVLIRLCRAACAGWFYPHTQGLLGAPGAGGGLLVFTEEGVSHVQERERERERE